MPHPNRDIGAHPFRSPGTPLVCVTNASSSFDCDRPLQGKTRKQASGHVYQDAASEVRELVRLPQ